VSGVSDRRGTSAEWPVIVLIASAGGVDALSRVVGALPAELSAALLVLLHVSPDRESALPEILARRSELPVAAAEDGMELTPGRVLVAPAGRHLLVTPDARLALIESGAFPPSRPSADLLLTTLALAVGARAITVVLSGGGHDGATGATAVHKFGGTVLASDEASSDAFAMPSATIDRDNAVDHVVPLDDIAELLVALVSAPRLDPGTTHQGRRE
jgi:two-component system chemotaxis response regulator CheB